MKKKSTWKKLAAALMTLALVLGSVNYTRSVYAETSPGSIEGAVGGNVEYELDSELAIVEGSANDTQVTVNVKVITKSSADAEVGEVKTAQITVPAGTKINFTVTPNTAGNPQYMLESLDDSAATNPWDANNGTTLVNAHRTRLEYDTAYNNEEVATGIAYKDADTIKWSLNGSTQPVCDFRVTAVSDRTLTITFHEIHRIAAQSLVYGENKVEWARSAEASLYSIEGDDYESVIAEMNRLYQKADSSQSGLGAPTKAEILLPVVKDNAWNANGESSEVWDSGNSYGMYKSYNMQNMLANMDAEEASRLKWASWLHQFTWSPFGNPEEGDTNQSVSTKTSLRRFTTTLNVTAIDINNMEYFTFGLSGEDRQIMTDANNGAYYNETEFGINDSMFVVVINATYPTGMLCFFGGVNFNEDRPVITWNGEDEERLAIANQRFWHSGQYKTPTAEEEALFKAKFPFTDGHYIDFETTEVADLKEFLAPGENRIEIFTDEDAEGGGMNEPCLYLKTNTSQNLSTQVITYTHNSDGDPVVDTSNDSGNGGATENPVNVQNSISTSGHVVPYGFPQVVTQKVTAGTDEYTFLGWDVYTYPNDATPAVPSGLELYNLTPETASRFNLTYFGSYDEQGNRLADEAADSQSKVNATDKSLRVDMKTNYHVVAKYVQNPPEPPVKGTVTVKKVDEDGNALTGAKFALYKQLDDEDINNGPWFELVGTAPEDDDPLTLDTFAFEVTQEKDVAMKYFLQEIKTPGDSGGYIIPAVLLGPADTLTDVNSADGKFYFTMKNGVIQNNNLHELTDSQGISVNKDNNTITVTNTLDPDKLTNITVKKVWDDGNNTARPVAKVQLLRNTDAAAPEPVGEPVVIGGEEWTQAEGGLAYTFTGLPVKNSGGARYTYSIKEIIYNSSDEEIPVVVGQEIDIDGDPADGYTVNITGNPTDGFVITNTLIDPDVPAFTPFYITLKKVDADNSEIALEGVVFDLQKKQADVWSEPGTPVTTGADGTATINITEAGDYRLVEKTNPNLGYAAEPVLTVEFTVLSDGTVTNPNYDNETETLTVKNKKEASEQPGPDPAAVVINKVDGNSDPLTGAGFTLTDGGTYSKVLPAEGGEPLSTFAFDNLADGTYTLTESTTPAGYAGLTEPITFTVTEGTVQTDFTPFDGTANTFTVTNTLTPPDPDPLTADAVISGTKKVVTNGSYKPAFNETFAFTLTQVSGPEGAPAVTVPNTSVTATKDGEYEFAFTVPGLVAGGYQFKIAEVAGTAPYWNYSAEEFTVDVTVGEVDGVFKAVTQPGTDERVFENTYSPTPPEFAGWSLWKVDAANPEAALSGAQFTVDGNALPETPGTGAYDLQSFLNEGLNVITEVLPPVNYTGIASPINLAVTVTTEGAVTVNIDHLNGGAPTGVVIDSARKKIIVPNTAMPPVPGDNPPPAEDNPPPAEYTPPFTPPPAATPNPDPTRRPPNPTPSAAPTPTTPPPTATPEPTEAPAPTLEPTPEPTLEPTPTPYASPTPWPLIFPDEPPAELPAEIVAEPETTDPNLQTAAVLPEGLPAAPVPHEGANLGQIDDFTYIEFDDEGIPLGVWTFDPGDPDDPNDDMWVFDEEIPLGMLEMPKTGELPVSAILLTLGLLLLLAAVVFRKKAAK